MKPTLLRPGDVRLTSTADGREHRVDDARYARAASEGAGELVAVCGRTVVMAALAAPPGTPCRDCVPGGFPDALTGCSFDSGRRATGRREAPGRTW